MSRPAAYAVVLCAVLLSACGTRGPKFERLPPAQMHDVLPPPPVSSPAPADGAVTAAASAAAAAQAAATETAAALEGAEAEVRTEDAGSSREFTVSLPKPDQGQKAGAAAAPAAQDAGWPRSFAATGVGFEVHMPQVQSWDGSSLVADALVLAQPDGQEQAVPGLVRLTADIALDEAAGTVDLHALALTDARFPTALDREQAWLELLRSFLPRSMKRLPLSHLQASARQAEALARGGAAVPAAPRVIVARNPALPGPIDGEPRFVPVPGTDLQGARNTRVVLLKDRAGKLYLRVYDGWVSATSLGGPWSVAKAPAGAERALEAAIASGRANLLVGRPDPESGKRPTLSRKNVPLIVVSARPAVLAGIDGEPRFAPVPGTGLQYVSNTQAHVFRETKSKRIYVRVGARWFQAASLRGPFEPVAADKLPADFARVPGEGRDGAVAASVVNRGASAAGAAADLPTVVAVARDQARFNVAIDGDPKLEPIAGTQLNYVTNASAPVIQLDIDHWYGVQNGVWFESRSATGPWTITADVPAAIYAIPATAPVYHALHSRVYASTADAVYYGYAADRATAPSDVGEDYQLAPPGGLVWGWFY